MSEVRFNWELYRRRNGTFNYGAAFTPGSVSARLSHEAPLARMVQERLHAGTGLVERIRILRKKRRKPRLTIVPCELPLPSLEVVAAVASLGMETDVSGHPPVQVVEVAP